MSKIKIITCSTRPGRKGPAIAEWVLNELKNETSAEVTLLDLKEINLPLFDEPNHPRLQKYDNEHTIKWSAEIEAADAFVFVMPEYNFSFPATIKNAIDYLFFEWQYKPVAFVSYGGISGGLRATQMMKEVVTTLKMMPIVESMSIPFFTKHIDENEKFISNATFEKQLKTMADELVKWTEAMKPLREKTN